MEGKLIKQEKEYYALYNNEGIFISDINGGSVANRLSIKNCEAVVNGYDLDELANRAFHYMGYHSTVTPHEEKQFKLGYNIAFREALEILGDKKFSEKELTMLFAYGHQIGMNDVLAIQSQHSPQPMPKPDSDKLRDELIQSLQQTEWDVEIVMECPECKEYGYISECRDVCNKKFLQPKLDADGCLILRRC